MTTSEYSLDIPLGAVLMALGALWIILYYLHKILGRWMRYLTIRKHGYPPVHCDVDGEACDLPKEEEQEVVPS